MRHVLLAWMLLGAALEARANYTLQISDVFWTGSPGGYNCFSGTAYPNTVNFTITKQQSGRRDYAVTAGPSSTTSRYDRQLASREARLNYQLYTTSSLNNVLKAPPAAVATEVISGSRTGGSGAVIPLSFVLYIPPNQLVPPGTYTDQVTVSVYESYLGTGAPFDTRTITITVTVQAGAALAVVPTGSGFSDSTSQNLAFGTLMTGQRLGCDLLVRKNTGCRLTFSSVNRGVMRMIPTPTADQVPYACTVYDLPLDLASPARLDLPPGVSPAPNGNRLPIAITIGDLGDAAAGDYQDQIIITLIAL